MIMIYNLCDRHDSHGIYVHILEFNIKMFLKYYINNNKLTFVVVVIAMRLMPISCIVENKSKNICYLLGKPL